MLLGEPGGTVGGWRYDGAASLRCEQLGDGGKTVGAGHPQRQKEAFEFGRNATLIILVVDFRIIN